MSRFKPLAELVKKHGLLMVSGGVLLQALVLAAMDRVPAGALTAGIFVVIVLFHYFPQLESFKAFTIEAKLRERLSEADQITAKLRSIALVTSEQAFYQLAWGNRWGGMPLASKRDIVADLGNLLADLEIGADRIATAKRPFIGSVLYDLYSRLDMLVRLRINVQIAQLRKKQSSIFGKDPIDMQSDKYARWEELQRAVSLLDAGFTRHEALSSFGEMSDFEQICRSIVALSKLPPEDLLLIERVRDVVIRLGEGCVAAGNITDEASIYLEARERPEDQFYQETFGEPYYAG